MGDGFSFTWAEEKPPKSEMNEQADCKGKGERLADLGDSEYQWEGEHLGWETAEAEVCWGVE